MSRPPVLIAGDIRTRDAGLALVVLALVVAATAGAARLHGVPPDLQPFWLACGLAVGPAVRWPWARVLPATSLAMLAGAWLGAALSWQALVVCAVAVGQCAVVGWGLRRSLPSLFADRRPTYRVRIAHLSRFLFANTLPAALLAGVLVALAHVSTGDLPQVAARAGLHHAAASALSIATLAPLLWWDQLRAVSWPAAVATALAAFAVPVLTASDARLIWLAPLVAIVAGFLGSIWLAVMAVAGLAAGFLVQGQSGAAMLPFEGPEGFLVWLLVVWRLLAAGLLAAVWSDRRARLQRGARRGGSVDASATAAWRRWRGEARACDDFLILVLESPSPALGAETATLSASGSSLRMRGVLHRLATHVRGGDAVVGLGAHGAMLILRLADHKAPDLPALRARCQTIAGDHVSLGWSGRLEGHSVAFLLLSAAHLEVEPAGELQENPARAAQPPGRTAADPQPA